ncbi:FHA domain-containing protein [Streptomyces sp. NPDC015661]|uniref:FHA domain-containing protein n=1 Tax=Streptomyces sp. NPDC015661 TaxID=3364961 RepID=UPI0036F9D414
MPLERHLTADFERAAFLVDLSNVVRDRTLGGRAGRSLHRLRLVVDAAAALARDPDVPLYLVSDRSLRLGGRHEWADPEEAERLGRWVGRGLVEELGDADQRVLELCEMTGIPVISGDFFRDARLAYRWIQGNTDDFLRPAPGPDGTVVLEPRDMGVASALAISRKLEESALKEKGLLDRRRKPLSEVVRRNWRCPDPHCTLYDTGRGSLALLPRMRGGVPRCEQHGRPLLDAGPRTATAQLKLLLDGEPVERFTLEDGTTVRVGRAPGPGGISLHGLVPAERTAGLSRAHVELRISGGTIHVRDLSSYGTRRRTTARRTGPDPWTPLVPGRDHGFHGGDELELVRGVVLARSGRRFPTELARRWLSRRPPEEPDAATTTYV